jgi:hypothetical protein
MKKRLATALALLKPVDDVERERFTAEIEDALSNIEGKRLRLKSDLTGADRKRLDQYRRALAKADRIFPKLHRHARIVIAGDGKIAARVPSLDHKKAITSIDRLLKTRPRPAHRDEADKSVAKEMARLILSRVGHRCSVDALASALYGTVSSLRNIK